MITGIVAIARNFAIGRDGTLPWHYGADLKFFKKITVGNAVVMGANTWRSIGRPLPDRTNIVLSRSGNVETPPGVLVFDEKGDVIDFANSFGGDTFIIGGAAIYREFADVIDRWIVTHIPETIDDADTFMPRNFLDEFDVTEEQDLGDDLHVRILQRR